MNDNIMKLLKDRYFLKDEKNWEDIAKRVSFLYPDIYEEIKNMDFIPSTPTLLNANTAGERKGTLSSCFPMNIGDSIEDIFNSLKEAAIVTKASGGVGFDYSFLRSSKENIESLNRNSSGPLPFINIFDSMLDGIQQNGVRRGAGMALLSIEHPDILDFIKAKSNTNKFNRNNFSVSVSNKFYEELISSPNKIHLVKLKNGSYIPLKDGEGKEVTVSQLWFLLMQNAWKTAEPGIMNYDIAWDRCSVKNVDNHVLSNPCNEFINIPYSSCNLGSINLSHLVEDKKFDWEKFSIIISKSVRFLNKVIDNNIFPIEKIKDVTLNIRPIGLGAMGLAHCLYKLEIPYNSKEAFEFTEKVFKYLTLKGMYESVRLAEEENKSYPKFDLNIFIKANKRFFNNECIYDLDTSKLKFDIEKNGIYNSCITSIAPTGSISTIAESSSGIEPVFALSYKRKIEKLNKEYDVMYITDKVFEKYLDNNYKEKKEIILEEISNNKGSCQKSKYLTDKEKSIFVTASDISPKDHIEILSAVANNISLSVSKTINLPKDASIFDVENVYLESWKKGIIGVTLYRDGCREGILIHDDKNKEEIEYKKDAKKRSKDIECDIYRIKIKNEEFTVLVGIDNETKKPYEIFVDNNHVDVTQHKKGIIRKEKKRHYNLIIGNKVVIENIAKSFNKIYGTLTRIISMSLRHGIDLEYIIDQLLKSDEFISFDKAIARVLKKYLEDGKIVKKSMICTNCGSNDFIYSDSCPTCKNCSFSKCG